MLKYKHVFNDKSYIILCYLFYVIWFSFYISDTNFEPVQLSENIKELILLTPLKDFTLS